MFIIVHTTLLLYFLFLFPFYSHITLINALKHKQK